jgi:uncharacterized protein (TIGR02231 family)
MNRIQNPKPKIHNLFFSLAFTLLSVLPLPAADIAADHRISAVTVFPDRALVTRRGTVSLTAGEHRIIFDNLPIRLDENSVRASGTGTGWKILGVEIQRDYREPAQSPEALKLRDQIRGLEDKRQDFQDERGDLGQKRDLLNKLSREASTASGGEDKKPAVSIADIQKLVEYYGQEINKISLRLRAIERAERDLDKDLDRLRAELAKLKNPGTPQNRKVAVTVEAATPTSAPVEISYMLHGASWSPQYDIHAAEDAKKITLTAYGVVRQNTGEHWENVKLTLSTARPQIGTALPDLNPWIIDIDRPMPSAAPALPDAKWELRRNAAVGFAAQDMLADAAKPENEAVQTLTANVEQRGFSAVYVISGTTTVPSDGEPHRSTISRQEMTANTEYTATPKLMPGAFVKAKVQNANPAPLLPGPLNVFMGNDFIGSSRLSLVGPEGVFDVFLGKDDGIKVQRKEKLRREETTGLVQKTRRIRCGYTIEIENMKRSEVTLTVKDQIPVSSDAKITVRASGIAPKPTQETKESGELQWEIKLKPKEKKTIEVDFDIEAPIDLPLTGI